jgi:hypothetical protein
VLSSPGARAGAGSVSGRLGPKTCPAAGRFRDRSRDPVLQAVPLRPKGPRFLDPGSTSPTLPTLRPRGLNSPKLALSENAPGLFPQPRGISPSRRSGSSLPSSAPALQPLCRKGHSPFRCLDDARPSRVGQGPASRLIHFRQFRQWTTLDNSTVRRSVEAFIPGRAAPAAAGVGH